MITKPPTYPSRTERRPLGLRRLTPRDYLVLRLVAFTQPTTIAQIQLYLGASHDVVRRRLAVLRDRGFVKVECPGGVAAPSRYFLTAHGVTELAGRFGDGPWRAPRGIKNLSFAHHDVSSELFIKLELAGARAKPKVDVIAYMAERELRRRAGGAKRILVPDAVILLEREGRRIAIALEADTGSERPTYFARTKSVLYAEAIERGDPLHGVPEWTVVVVTRNDTRVRALVTACGELGLVLDHFMVFGVESELSDRNVLASGTWLGIETRGDEARLVPSSLIRTTPPNPSGYVTGEKLAYERILTRTTLQPSTRERP